MCLLDGQIIFQLQDFDMEKFRVLHGLMSILVHGTNNQHSPLMLLQICHLFFTCVCLAETTNCAVGCRGSCWGTHVDDCQRPPEGSLLFNDTLIDETEGCPTGYYFDDFVCMPCDSSCATCNGPGENDCLTCTGTLVLNNSTCETACPTGFYNRNGTCTVCPDEVF